MGCCSFPQRLPHGFNPIPDFQVTKSNQIAVEDLGKKIAKNRTVYSNTPPDYRSRVGVRVVVIALLIVGITVGVLALEGNLLTFPDHFLRTVHNINWMYVGIGMSAFTLLTVGAAIIIHRVKHLNDRITKHTTADLRGDDHWVSAVYHRKDFPNYYFPGYIDTSTLDEKQSGIAFMYAHKDTQQHYSVSIAVTIFTPVHLVGAVAYNALRFVAISFYILGCLIYEAASGKTLEKGRPYCFSDIPKEMGKSLLRIIKAPFYATAYIFAALYSFIDPLNGRKLGSYIERDWNEGVTRSEGFWSVQGPQSLWKFEGGGTPSGLGKNGFYLAGCWQPVAVVSYKEGKIVEGMGLSRAVNSKRGKNYTVFTREMLVQKHNKFVKKLEKYKSL